MRRSLVNPTILLLPFVLLAAGCSGGKKKSEVKGTITVDNKPLSAGTITFHNNPEKPKDKIVESGDIEDGSYTVKGLTPGEYKVTVSVESLREKVNALPQKELDAAGAEERIKMGKAMAEKTGKTFDDSDLRAQVDTMREEIKKLKKLQKNMPPPLPKKYLQDTTTTITVTVPSGGGELAAINLDSK